MKKLDGYWAVDVDKMLETVEEAFKAQTGQETLPPGMLDEMKAQMANMVGYMKDGKSVVYSPGGSQEETDLKILSVNGETGEFTMESTPAGGAPAQTVSGKLEGDVLSTSANGMPIVLRRIDEATYKKRRAALESAPVPTPPAVPAPTPPPAIPTPTPAPTTAPAPKPAPAPGN